MEHGQESYNAAEDTVEDVIRVAANSNANALGQAIAHSVYDRKIPKLRAVGAGAVNQAIKAIAIARGYVAPRGMNLSVVPGFETITIRDKEISSITLQLIVEG